MFKEYNLVEKVFCKDCGLVEYDIVISEEFNCPVGQLVCVECGVSIGLNNKHNTTLLSSSDIIELQLATMKLEDIARLKQQSQRISMNLKVRDKIKKHKREKLYNKTSKNTFTLGGAYYKQNHETGDYFLSKYSYGTKKYYQKESNNKTRNSNNFGLKGSNYKKLYDIEWKII